jgi:hypothetical protein
MNLIKKLDQLSTRYITNSNALVYNAVRSVRCKLDKYKLSGYIDKKIPLTLVYQQGRVGSTSVYEALQSAQLGHPVYHVHTIDSDNASKQIYKQKIRKEKVYRNLFIGKYLGDLISSGRKTQKWNIVCIFRDPIAVVMSLYFMNAKSSFKGTLNDEGTIDPSLAMEHLRTLFENDDPNDWAVVNWFDTIFYHEVGVNVYDYKFDYDKGYVVIETEEYRIILLKLESLKEQFSAAMADFYNTDETKFALKVANVHRDQKQDEVHQIVKKDFELTQKNCQKVYQTKFVEHFYSPSEIELLAKKWTKSPD